MLGINLNVDTSSSSVSKKDCPALFAAVVTAVDLARLYLSKSFPSILNMYNFLLSSKKSNSGDRLSLITTQ